MTVDPQIQELIDRIAIRDVMIRYARDLDRRDFDLVASCFTSDAYAAYSDNENAGLENIVSRLRRSVSRFQSSTHFMGDQSVEISSDTAEVQTYAIDYLLYTVDGTQSQSVGGLRYQDTMVRGDGLWKISHRVMHTDWRRNSLVDASVPGPDRVPVPE